jgi:hypothetical protein
MENRLVEARKRRIEANEIQREVHVVFSLSDAGFLKVTLSNLGMRLENKVMAFNELFSIGPLVDMENTEGQGHRRKWFQERFPFYKMDSLSNREHQIENVIDQIAQIPESKSINIWCANNAHDQVGLRFAMYLLKEREQPIRVINVSEMHKKFSIDVPPYAQGLISEDMFQKIVSQYEHIVPLDPNQRHHFESEWLELSTKGGTLRIWDNEEIKGLEEDELDNVILSAILLLQQEETLDGFVKAGRVVGKVFENFSQVLSDQFIEYRIWKLISDGNVSFKGLPFAMFQYSVRLA